MKHINRNLLFLMIGLALAGTIGCSKSDLDEYNPASRTAETYYNTPAGFEGFGKIKLSKFAEHRKFFNPLSFGTDAFQPLP